MESIYLSVIIPTFNPDPEFLGKVLKALQSQTYPISNWELIIIDNNSTNDVLDKLNLTWHSKGKIIKENKQGLTYSRLCGFEAAIGEFIIMVDDDNVLADNYLEETIKIFSSDKNLGAIGGKSLPVFESTPPVWLTEFYNSLALRDLGNEPVVSAWRNEYPHNAPIGAGMAIRKEALTAYLANLEGRSYNVTDRIGSSLSSGGDNEIVLSVLQNSWRVGYFPTLLLQHIIPAWRMEPTYLAKLINHTNRSWVQVLENNGINPWRRISRKSLALRKIKSWFTYRAWSNKANYLRWQGACGLFNGLASLKTNAE